MSNMISAWLAGYVGVMARRKIISSGLVNSLKVGSEMTVWEIVWTGSSRQLTSFGRQDLMQRMVSVFSSLTVSPDLR